MNSTNPLFIAFEGIDGCGKSTQAQILADKLRSAGHLVHVTCEPTDSPIGSLIKSIFRHQYEADHRTIAGLFVADRLDHLLNKPNGILKKMEEGYFVICDRYYFSSYAYQSVHMPMEWVIHANSLSAGMLRPNLNIFIDIDPELSIGRINRDRSNPELYETLDNLRKVRAKYFEAFEILKSEERVFISDGNRPVQDIASQLWKEVFALTGSHPIESIE